MPICHDAIRVYNAWRDFGIFCGEIPEPPGWQMPREGLQMGDIFGERQAEVLVNAMAQSVIDFHEAKDAEWAERKEGP